MKLKLRQLDLLKQLMISSGKRGNLPNASIIVAGDGSRYWNKIPWVAESKTIDKHRLVKKFLEKVKYEHLSDYEADFSSIFDEYVHKVISRDV